MARDLMGSKKNRNSAQRQSTQSYSGKAASRTSQSTNPKGGQKAAAFNAGNKKVDGINMEDVDIDQVNSVVDSMRGKSEQEMQDELFRVADEQFKTGNVNISDIDAFAKQAAGMLNPEQQKKLNMLTGMLKNRAKNK